MKKILAIVLAVVMMFSVTVPASAAFDFNADDANEVIGNVSAGAQEAIDSAKDLFGKMEAKDVFGSLESGVEFAAKLANAIHTLVHSLSVLFDFDCPFCDEKKAEKPDEPTEPEQPEEPELVLPENVPTEPAAPVHPEGAVKVESVAALADAMANAEDGAYIVLADGLYDEIVVTKSNITLAADNAKVGFVNLNGKSNVTIIGFDFLADYAKEAVKANSNASAGYYANIVGTQTPVKSNGHDIVIKDCTFTGTPVNSSYAPIFVNDQKRSGTHAYNYTVDGCIFAVDAAYYVYLNYLQKGTITIKNNVLGGEDYACAGAFWGSSNGSDLIIKDNYMYNWSGAAIGTSRSGAAYDIKLAIENNSFVQVADGASTMSLYLKNYKSTDVITLATLLTDSNAYYGTITAENAVIENI